jgi:fumarate hydratase class II
MEEALVDLLARLRRDGFTESLRVEGDTVVAGERGRRYAAAELALVGVHRLDGSTDPADASVAYALEAPDGLRGVVVDAWGAYASPEVSAALARVRRAETRDEADAMGAIPVLAERYWGAQTQRSLAFFAIGDERMPLAIVHAIALVKRAAAEVNAELGLLAREQADAIATAADEVAGGALDAHFPLSVWQTGSGTQTHMNVNEVVANRASELLGGGRGVERRVDPHDDVNRGQSSNDVFPTALHVAAVRALEDVLIPAVRELHAALADQAAQFAGLVKIGRTHTMDAVPLTLGQEFSGWAAQLEEGLARLARASQELRPLAIGGTAVGTGVGAHPAFGAKVAERLSALCGLAFTSHPNKFAALAAHDAVVSASGALRTLAGSLLKIASDLRWLASGPRAGLGELRLPENEPGSSIMPGKVNPTQCEALAMVCLQVMGHDAAIAAATSQGLLELHVAKPLLAHALLQSIELLAGACRSFARNCVRGIEADEARLAEHVASSLMLVTALSPHIGYDAAARIARKAHAEGTSLREAALALGLVTPAQYDAWVRPERMVGAARDEGGA